MTRLGHVNIVTNHLVDRECPAPSADRGVGIRHVAFDCDDADLVETRPKEADLPFAKVQASAVEVLQFNLTDPNGVRVELTLGHENLRRPSD